MCISKEKKNYNYIEIIVFILVSTEGHVDDIYDIYNKYVWLFFIEHVSEFGCLLSR